MVYMGDVLSGEGLRFSSDLVKAIVEAPAPQNVFEVRSFLSSVQFCAKFIPNFATISNGVLSRMKPFTKSKTGRFVHQLWLATDKVFPTASRLMPRRLELEPFLNRSKRMGRTDQSEREALVVRWACQKFYLYLYGIKFEICTDHNPLVTLLGSQPPSTRIERWLLYLQQLPHELTQIRR